MKTFKEKVEQWKDSYSGEPVKQQLGNAYQTGIEHLSVELKNRFEAEAEKKL